MKSKGVLSVAILTTVLCIGANSFAVLSGGGTQENPYLIQSRTDFDDFANPANAAIYWSSGVYTKLMCNLNLSGTTYTQAVIAPDTDTADETDDFVGTQFAGIFDGNGHTISNLYIEGAGNSYVGLFGYLGPAGQIINLGVVNANIQADDYVGILSGENDNGLILYCCATGSVTGANYIGGLVGENDHGWIIRCYSKANVSGTGDNIGGLAGESTAYGIQDIISCCYATGNVTGTGSYIGGLAGIADPGTFSCCFWDT